MDPSSGAEAEHTNPFPKDEKGSLFWIIKARGRPGWLCRGFLQDQRVSVRQISCLSVAHDRRGKVVGKVWAQRGRLR